MSKVNVVSIAANLRESLPAKVRHRLASVWADDKARLKLPSVRRVFYEYPKFLGRVEREINAFFKDSPRLANLHSTAVLRYVLADLTPTSCPNCGSQFLLGKYCSLSCASIHAARSDASNAKRDATNLKRYGDVNVSRCPEVLAKGRAKRDEAAINEKREQTNLQRYGSKNVSGTKAVRAKTDAVWITNHGSVAERYRKAHLKSQATCLDRYGVQFNFQDEGVKQGIRKTFIKKYGVPNPLQSADVWERATKSGYLKRRVKFKDGVVRTIQGSYEQTVVRRLLDSGWNVDAPGFSLRYKFRGSTHFYHPDFLITKGSRTILIEVKSEYTLIKDLEKNLAKFRSANRYCKKHNITFGLCILKETPADAKILSCIFPTKRSALGLTKRLNSI